MIPGCGAGSNIDDVLNRLNAFSCECWTKLIRQ